MEKKLPASLVLPQVLTHCFYYLNLYFGKISSSKTKLSLLFLFVCFSLWAQPPHTFNSNGSIVVPAGITTMDVQAWGGGGAGGGASGAVLDGRAAAGGGGGAYARSNITVAAGATLNASVAGTTTNALVSGAAVNGAAGGSSTIFGFETSILALGGSGGGANNAGGTPAGGAGGSAASSVGNVSKLDGAAGGNGVTGAVGLLTVSGAGGTAGGGGGAGGAGVASVALGNGPGNAGTAPGGGGSGAMQSLLGGAQIGGSGAAGRVIITYTCPTYSITGISAANVCNSVGTTSVVTLTSSGGGLPIGPYVVTYNRSNPSGTGLTAIMNVTTAGTGTFTAAGLNVIGTSNITVTNLTSAACSSNIAANNVASLTVFAATVGGTLAGTATVCSGATSGTLTLSGQTGSIIRWESSVSPFTVWTIIPNTTNTYTSGALTETTQFRAVIQNGNCAVVNSSIATITVNPLPQGSLSANGPFCVTGSGQLTFTATAGTGPYTIVYKENGGADRTAANISSGAAFPTFTTPVTATTVYTLVSVTGSNTCSRSSGFTNNTATITVNSRIATPGFGTVTQPDCVTSTGSVVLTGLPAGSWTITQSGTASQTYNSSGTTYTISNLAVGNYTFTVQDAANCPSLATSTLTLIAPVVNIWNGTSWSKGSPPISTDVVRFSGNYSTTGNLSGCSLIVDSGFTVTVNSNHTLTISNAVTNNGGQLIFENNSSLLQTNNVTNVGNITYKRITPPVRRYDLTYWSSPITRTPPFTLYDLSPGTLADKYYSYDPVAGWVISFNGTQQMIPGRGYVVRAPQTNDLNTGANYLGAFVGVPNNGPISVSLGTAEAFQLLGNPYPSAIYADQFIANNSANLYGTLYFWTHNSLPSSSTPGGAQYNYDNNDYAVYNLSGSIIVGGMTGQGATTPGNQSAPLGYIAAGQGFFVVSKTTGNAVFTNSMRVAANNTQFYKTNKSAIERHRVWINLTNTQGAFKQLLIGYIEGATNFWDHNYDAITADANPYVDFYSINEGQNLVIQGRSLPFNESDVIPLGYRSAIAGEFSISLDHADGDLTNHAVYLEDKLTNTLHNLQTSNYTFNTAIGTFSDRFVIRYTTATLGTDDFENQTNSFYVSVKDKTIKLNSTEDVMREVSIFDISGKLLYNNKKVENTEFQVSNFQSGNQVLIVKVTLHNGNIITKKIVFN
jgi:hypothetical protein